MFYIDYDYKEQLWMIYSREKIFNLGQFFSKYNVSNNKLLYLTILNKLKYIHPQFQHQPIKAQRTLEYNYKLAAFKSKQEAEDFYNNYMSPYITAKSLLRD